MNQQRVLVIVRSLKMGGMEKVAVNLCDAIAELGHEAHLLSFKDVESAISPTNPNVIQHQIDLDRLNRLTVIGLFYDILIRAPLNLLFRKSGFIWRGFYSAPLFRFYLSRLERQCGRFDKIIVRGQGTFENLWRVKDPRLVICLESNVNLNPDSWKGRWFARALYKNKNIVCVSNGVQDNFKAFAEKAGSTPSSVRVITNPMPIAQIRRLSEEPSNLIPDEPYIVNVARLVPVKNQALLLRAYAVSGISERLLMVGSGKLESELRELADELGITSRVSFTGNVMNPYPLMKNARLFVLSSRVEGLGIVLVESLACGTPVVAVDCPGGIRDVLVDEQVNYLSQQDADDLAEKIRLGLRNPPVIREEWVLKFEAKNVAARFVEGDEEVRI